MTLGSFDKLFEPGQIGSVRIKNRIVKMGAQVPGIRWEDGYVQQRYVDFYEAIARGGAGLVTVAGCEMGRFFLEEGFAMDDDKYIPGLKKIADVIHKYDCPAFIQMVHIGPWVPNPIGASTMNREEYPMSLDLPRELTVPEIKNIVNEFGEQTERAFKAGFQGVELNAGTNHLLNSFLSPGWNWRKDEYGGSSENRARIVIEIIQEIKKRNGKDFAVIVLYNAVEPGLENGLTLEEGQKLAQIFEKGGADAIHPREEFYVHRKSNRWQGRLSNRKHDSTHFPDVAFYPETPSIATPDITDTRGHGAGGWVPTITAIKQVVKVPVIAVGRLDWNMGEKLLKENKADFIYLNRRLMADHDMPAKLKEGRLKDIAPCTACMTCFGQLGLGEFYFTRCRVNAGFGREKEYEIKPAANKKKVMIIGGGPGGMEAARVAALRGHEVILYEKERLGGASNLAAIIKGTEKEDILGLMDYLKYQITKAGVDIRLGKAATRATVQEIKPDVVIVAVGGNHNNLDIPGVKNKKVMTSESLHHQMKTFIKIFGPKLMAKLVKLYLPVGKNVVVMGGSIHGCQTAEFLVKRGRKVTLLETGPEIGVGLLPHLIKPQLLDWLEKRDVVMMSGVKYEKITDEGVVITTENGEKQIIKADTILTVLPLLPNNALADSLKGTAPEVYTVGDCKEPDMIARAISEAAAIAIKI